MDISHIKKTVRLRMKFPRLDEDSLNLRMFSDSYFANNSDITSHTESIILLCDKNEK